MPPLLRRAIIPLLFATIFVIIPFFVITLATDDEPIIAQEETFVP